MRKSLREKLAEAKREGAPQQAVAGFDGILKLLLGGDPRPTQYKFITDTERLKAYKGPAGCAKTSTLVSGGLLRALFSPGSKGLIARQDYNDLLGTTGLRAQEMIDRLPPGILLERDKSPPMRWWIRPIPRRDPVTGETVDTPSMITFMGLKDSLGSYEFDWAAVDEADETDEARIHEITTRLRHTKAFMPNYALSLAFNPPDKTHWLYTACTGKDFQEKAVAPPWLKLYEPIPNENAINLKAGYYEELTRTLPEDMKQRLVDGEWGSTFLGAPVYRPFKYAVHVRDGLAFDPQRPLLRGWDFGYYRPACVWAQFTWQGHLLILKEYLGHQMDAAEFARRCKALTAEWFPVHGGVVDFGDPAVVQKKDTGRTLSVLSAEGIQMRFRSSLIHEGVEIIRRLLNTMIDGAPAIQFDRRGAPITVQAMRGGYHLDDKVPEGGANSKGLKPKKDGFFEHIADALRYLVLNVVGGGGYSASGGSGGSSSGGAGNLPTDVSYDPAA